LAFHENLKKLGQKYISANTRIPLCSDRIKWDGWVSCRFSRIALTLLISLFILNLMLARLSKLDFHQDPCLCAW